MLPTAGRVELGAAGGRRIVVRLGGSAGCAGPRAAAAGGVREVRQAINRQLPKLPGMGSTLKRQSLHSREITQTERRSVIASGEGRGDGGGFIAGVFLGGLVFGVLGFLYAPQISATLLDEHHRLRLPKFLEVDPPQPVTKEDLVNRMDELNRAVDKLSAELVNPAGNSKEPASKQAV